MKYIGDIIFLVIIVSIIVLYFNIDNKKADYKEMALYVHQLCNAQLKCPKTLPEWKPHKGKKGILHKGSMRYYPNYEKSKFMKFRLTQLYGPDMQDQAIGGVNMALEYYVYNEVQGGFLLEEPK